MKKFKQGDQVKAVEDLGNGRIVAGEVCTVSYAEANSYEGKYAYFITSNYSGVTDWVGEDLITYANPYRLFKDDIRDYKVGELVMVVDDTYRDAPHKMDMYSIGVINDETLTKIGDRRRVYVNVGNYKGEYRWVANKDVIALDLTSEHIEGDFEVDDYLVPLYETGVLLVKVIEKEGNMMKAKILDHNYMYTECAGDCLTVENSNKKFKKVEIN